MTDLQIFNNSDFGEVRTVEESGKVLFCGSDVAKALGYVNTRDALDRHCKTDGVAFHDIIDNLGRTQQAKFIDEGNLYRLIINSKLPTAEKFEKWVFDEVIPSIHKHGAYMTPQKIEEVLLNPDTIIQLATALKNERTKALLLEQRVAEYEPKIQYLDQILQSQGTLTITQIAADYGMSAYQLNKMLFMENIQRKVNGQWILYKEHMNLGYTKSETINFIHSDGTADTKLNTRFTQKGRLMIHTILTARGIKANVDRLNAS